jgi:hypothetical protein
MELNKELKNLSFENLQQHITTLNSQFETAILNYKNNYIMSNINKNEETKRIFNNSEKEIDDIIKKIFQVFLVVKKENEFGMEKLNTIKGKYHKNEDSLDYLDDKLSASKKLLSEVNDINKYSKEKSYEIIIGILGLVCALGFVLVAIRNKSGGMVNTHTR